MDLPISGLGQIVSFCVHGHENSCSIKFKEFPDYMKDYWIFKKGADVNLVS